MNPTANESVIAALAVSTVATALYANRLRKELKLRRSLDGLHSSAYKLATDIIFNDEFNTIISKEF